MRAEALILFLSLSHQHRSADHDVGLGHRFVLIIESQNVRCVVLAAIRFVKLVPLFFAYGRWRHDETLCERAFALLEQLGAENNFITRSWRAAGIRVESAADSQALVHLRRNYCDRKDCLRCRFGYEYLRDGAGQSSVSLS